MPEVAGGIGTIGFCLGGRMVVKTAARHEVACAVSYYGVGIEDCLDLLGPPHANGSQLVPD